MGVDTKSQLVDRTGRILSTQIYDNARALFQPYVPDFEDAVALGMIAGCTRTSGIGYNPDIDIASTPEDCWGGSGLFNFSNIAVAMQIRSTDAADSASGTGMRTVQITALDENYLQAPVSITLNGTTAVALPSNVMASNGMRGLTAGSNGTNVGQIILEVAGAPGGTMYGTILAGAGTTYQAAYTVPAGLTLVIPQMLFNVNSVGGGNSFFAQVKTWFRFFNASNLSCEIQPLVIGLNNGMPYAHLAKPPIMVPEKTRFSLRVSIASDNNTAVTAGWNGYTRANS